jgi:hypothetical protein
MKRAMSLGAFSLELIALECSIGSRRQKAKEG